MLSLTSPKTLKSLIKPNKRLGQNFLVSEAARARMVDAAELTGEDVVVEAGAGIGTITTELAGRAKKVIAIEKDRALIPALKETTKDFDNVEIVLGDILKFEKFPPKADPPLAEETDLSLLAPSGVEGVIGHWSLVGNIPYYLTAPLIRKFIETERGGRTPKSLTLMVQKEMAQRICAKPPDMSILAVSVQVYAKPQIIGYVPRSAFWPQPEVDSAILKIVPYPHDRENVARGGEKFFSIVRAGFSSPRKQLLNNLSGGLKMSRGDTEQWLLSAGIDPKRRAETLTVGEWISLHRKLI